MIELADLIRDLRTELATAIVAAPGNGLRFELGPVEVQVTVTVEKRGGVGAKVRFLVVDASAEAQASRTATQRITLTLQPTLGAGSRPPEVSGERTDHEW